MPFIGKLNITKIKQVNENTKEKAHPQKLTCSKVRFTAN